ncbi:site-specific DNA-methyltransferase (Type III DNA modification enzyme) (plasmid) [Desulforapulum autotrophicum HRM2]|uniref:site-specific DNA-methyltransferase (adenine-specific) n=1 Tax=Desulforapulum autotrophicum (strain ATCC 43914 / DSM 3382 / VKM B-1955 / HRM2) TaxID=177437 RepID=C0QMP1_DESAH|nr:site-specific DNA-methyltransferase [Desulforapulum autotrophicum]ACN18035.1 site-specific DNA-methyltransferase (Type III DNA modification enzyme) [Desulforapulum autotrophicum HRM2]
MEKMDGKTMDIVAENVGKLKELFPEAFTEGKVDFEALKEVLGTFVDDRDERYSFTWNGKSKARMIAQTPSTGTLRPCKEESIDWGSTQNIFIEGDNLEVLKLLQKSYHKKVKMIYIDPPYNTGKDFVYKDNFKDNIKNYKEITGQVDGEGRNLSNNPETSGRYHTDWLNMMYPRLKLARNLLKDDGVIFISIDDNEVSNLRKMCDEVFGDENFIAIFPWRSRTAKADVPFGVSCDVEWIVCYGKPYFVAGRLGERKYYQSDDFSEPWRMQDSTTNKTKEERPNSFFTMINPKNGEEFPANETRTWCVTEDTFPEYYKNGKIVFPGDYDFLNIKRPAFRVFENEDREKAFKKYGTEEVRMAISSYLPEKDVGRTEHGSKEIRNLFGPQVFSYPKPTGLIKFFVENISDPDAIIMDFFAGSGTTADAMMQQNASDKGNRKFLLVQLPEVINPTKNEQQTAAQYCIQNKLPLKITELTKARISLAAAKIKEENPEYDGDLGFKAFKLDSTNIKPWEVDFDMTERTLEDFISNIKTDRREEDVLYEILLKYGLDLTLPISEHTIAGQKVFDIGMGALIICLADAISLEVVEGIAKLKDELNPEIMRVVFKDSGFKDDVVKTNAVQILKQAGIVDVRSL